MSKYAKINDNNIVENIIICEDSEISTQNGHHVKVTESTNDAQIGFEYDFSKNKFKAPQPFESWTLNADTLLWEAAVDKPLEGSFRWDETEQNWIKVS
jgi:hypothetical protein